MKIQDKNLVKFCKRDLQGSTGNEALNIMNSNCLKSKLLKRCDGYKYFTTLHTANSATAMLSFQKVR
jgi:hypothetical protein